MVKARDTPGAKTITWVIPKIPTINSVNPENAIQNKIKKQKNPVHAKQGEAIMFQGVFIYKVSKK